MVPDIDSLDLGIESSDWLLDGWMDGWMDGLTD